MCSPRGIAALALAGSTLLAAAPASAATRVTPLTPSKKVINPPTRIVGKTVTGLKPKISTKISAPVINGQLPAAVNLTNHAILALGYDSEGLLLQNSWGTDWGNKGYGKVYWAWALKGVFGAIVLNTSADPFLKPKSS